VGGASIEAGSVGSSEDRSIVAFADGQVDCPGDSWWQRDGCRLVALADDRECSVASLDAEIFDVGGTCFADPQSVQPEQHRERGVVVVDAFCGEQKPAEFLAVEAGALAGVDLGSAYVLGGVGSNVAVDVRESVEAAHGGEPPVDRGRCQSSVFERRPVGLDVWAGRGEHVEFAVGGPLEERAQVVAVRVERVSVVAGEKRCRGDFGRVGRRDGAADVDGKRRVGVFMAGPPQEQEDQHTPASRSRRFGTALAPGFDSGTTSAGPLGPRAFQIIRTTHLLGWCCGLVEANSGA